MLDRQKVETILSRRFPGSALPQIAAAVNAIMGIDGEWEEVPPGLIERTLREPEPNAELRLFRRRPAG